MPPVCCVIGRGWKENATNWYDDEEDIEEDFERTLYLIDPTGHSLLGGIGGPWVMNRSTALYVDIKDDCDADLVADITKPSLALNALESSFHWVWFENVGDVAEVAQAMKNAVKLTKKYVVVNGGNVTDVSWGDTYMRPYGIRNYRYVKPVIRTYLPKWYIDERGETDEPIDTNGLTSVTGAAIKAAWKGKGDLSFCKAKTKFSAELVPELLPNVATYYYLDETEPLIYGEVSK